MSFLKHEGSHDNLKGQRILLLHRGGQHIRGTEVCLIQFSEALKGAGARLYLICNNLNFLNESIGIEESHTMEMTVADVIYSKRFWSQPYLKHLIDVVKLANFCRANSIDAIYASGGAPTQLAVHARRFLKLNVTVFSHFHHPCTALYYKSWSLKRADIIVCPSRYTASDLLASDIASKVIYNGVNVKMPVVNQSLAKEAAVRACFVGQLESNKRVDWLLRAVAMLKARGCRLHLDIVGTGTEQQPLLELSKELNIDERVTFHGRIDSIYDVLVGADFSVMASDVEGLGISVIEAAVCGIPSIVSASTGLLEVVEDGYSGWYFDSSSLESLADILEQRTLADDNHVFGENARERAVRVFSEESYKKEMLSAFSSAAF